MTAAAGPAGDGALAVVQRHLDAVAAGTDPGAMARDYAQDAVLIRPGARLVGQSAIADYFADVPTRLGGGRVELEPPAHDRGDVVFRWRIVGGPGDGASGTDRCTVVGDAITVQVVTLDAADF